MGVSPSYLTDSKGDLVDMRLNEGIHLPRPCAFGWLRSPSESSPTIGASPK